MLSCHINPLIIDIHLLRDSQSQRCCIFLMSCYCCCWNLYIYRVNKYHMAVREVWQLIVVFEFNSFDFLCIQSSMVIDCTGSTAHHYINSFGITFFNTFCIHFLSHVHLQTPSCSYTDLCLYFVGICSFWIDQLIVCDTIICGVDVSFQ